MTFNYSGIIPQPFRDFVKRYTGLGAKAGECRSHAVNSHPGKPYCGTVILERSGEIVTVTVASARYIGSELVWVSEPVAFKKLQKCLCKWNCAFFPVFTDERGRVPDVNVSSLKVKPGSPGLDDLVLP